MERQQPRRRPRVNIVGTRDRADRADSPGFPAPRRSGSRCGPRTLRLTKGGSRTGCPLRFPERPTHLGDPGGWIWGRTDGAGGDRQRVAGDTVLVMPGRYYENLNYTGKEIVVRSDSGPRLTILDGSHKRGSVVVIRSRGRARSGPRRVHDHRRGGGTAWTERAIQYRQVGGVLALLEPAHDSGKHDRWQQRGIRRRCPAAGWQWAPIIQGQHDSGQPGSCQRGRGWGRIVRGDREQPHRGKQQPTRGMAEGSGRGFRAMSWTW